MHTGQRLNEPICGKHNWTGLKSRTANSLYTQPLPGMERTHKRGQLLRQPLVNFQEIIDTGLVYLSDALCQMFAVDEQLLFVRFTAKVDATIRNLRGKFRP